MSSVVSKARDKLTGKLVALKQIKTDAEADGVRTTCGCHGAGAVRLTPLFLPSPFSCRVLCPQFPISAMREISILKQLKHPNVVELVDMVTEQGECRRSVSCGGKLQLTVVDRDGCHDPACDANQGKMQVFMCFEYLEYDVAGLQEHTGVHLTAVCEYNTHACTPAVDGCGYVSSTPRWLTRHVCTYGRPMCGHT